MPWTFAHPAAVLPLRKFCPTRLDLSALVIGSMIPDLGYYILQFNVARFAHSFLGCFLICLPTGLALYGLFHLLRKPLWFVLPQPHRGALAASATAPLALHPRTLIVAALSVLLGTWTHIVWDSFTHNRWLVKALPFLRESVFRVGSVDFPLYALLQHLSTVVGAVMLIAAYCSWLRLHGGSARTLVPAADDRWRYLLLVAVTTLALAIAVPRAVVGYPAIHVMVFRMVIDTTVAFSTLLTLSSVLLYATRREGRQRVH